LRLLSRQLFSWRWLFLDETHALGRLLFDFAGSRWLRPGIDCWFLLVTLALTFGTVPDDGGLLGLFFCGIILRSSKLMLVRFLPAPPGEEIRVESLEEVEGFGDAAFDKVDEEGQDQQFNHTSFIVKIYFNRSTRQGLG
jgi:hypothetical protein